MATQTHDEHGEDYEFKRPINVPEKPLWSIASTASYIDKLVTGSFLENAVKTKFRVERFDTHFILIELDNNGKDEVGAKKRKFEHNTLNGLLNNKHFSISTTGRRLMHGELEARLEFNKLSPK